MPAKLSTHVLDLTRGTPAAGMEIELWHLGNETAQLKVVTTNADGRTDHPLLGPDEMEVGDFQLIFKLRDYYAKHGVECPFFLYASIFFHISDVTASYHVPLLASPWGYNTYRGS